MPDDLPHDADGDALRRLRATGSDLSQEMEVDFAVAVLDEDSGKEFAKTAEDLGFRTEVSKDKKSDKWTCYCTRVIVPTYDAIIGIQAQLDEVGRAYGAKSDGWGSFGNNKSE